LVLGDLGAQERSGFSFRAEPSELPFIAPRPNGSALSCERQSLRGGRASVRTALYLAAMTAARFNPVLRELYQRLRQAGKPAKLAFVAVARKLRTVLNAIARERTAWKATIS